MARDAGAPAPTLRHVTPAPGPGIHRESVTVTVTDKRSLGSGPYRLGLPESGARSLVGPRPLAGFRLQGFHNPLAVQLSDWASHGDSEVQPFAKFKLTRCQELAKVELDIEPQLEVEVCQWITQ
jgi:hypothetical protein